MEGFYRKYLQSLFKWCHPMLQDIMCIRWRVFTVSTYNPFSSGATQCRKAQYFRRSVCIKYLQSLLKWCQESPDGKEVWSLMFILIPGSSYGVKYALWGYFIYFIQKGPEGRNGGHFHLLQYFCKRKVSNTIYEETKLEQQWLQWLHTIFITNTIHESIGDHQWMSVGKAF